MAAIGFSAPVNLAFGDWRRMVHGCGALLLWRTRFYGYSECLEFATPTGTGITVCPRCGGRLQWPSETEQRASYAYTEAQHEQAV